MQADNLKPMVLLITIFAGLFIVAALVAALSQAYWLIAYSQQMEGYLALIIAGISSYASAGLYLLTIIPVLIWIYLAHDNLRKEGLTGLNHSPGWAAFCFFIPFANLYFPFDAMRELANRSAGEPEELASAEVDEVFSWWGCWLGSIFLSTVLAIVVAIDSMPGVWVTTPFWATQVLVILSLVLSAGSAFFLIKVARMVTNDQVNGTARIGVFD